MKRIKQIFRLDGRVFPVMVIVGIVLLLLGRYLAYGVPHEFITGEYKGTFEGDYDFTLELVRTFAAWWRIPLWSDTYSGPIAVFASNFHVFEQALLYPFTGSLSLSIKILQALQFLVAGLGMYCLSSYLFKDRVAAVFSAVLYMFSPFYIGHLLSYLHYTGVYLLGPLVFYLILRTLDERSIRLALLLSVVAAYSLLSHPQNIFIGGVFYALFFFLIAAHGIYDAFGEGEGRIYLKSLVTISIVVVVATGLLSAFIMWPTLAHDYPYLRTSWVKGAKALVHVDHGHIKSHSQSMLSTLTMQHWPWLQTPLKGGEYPPWDYMAIYLMPFLFASVSLLIRFNWLTLVLVMMTVLSVQIAQGVRGEPDLFTLASRYLPFFGMSRTPYTYVNTSLLVFCLLPSVTFIWLAKKLEGLWSAGAAPSGGGSNIAEGLKNPVVRWFLLAIFVVPYLMAARYYGTNYNWTLISAKQPEYLASVWGWMDENNDTRGRVIETCGIPTAMILGQRMLPNQVDLLERFHRKDYLDDYLALMGFRYVITPSMHSQRNKTFDVRGYTPPSVFDRGERMNEYYSALTTEYYHIYERLLGDPRFELNTAGTRDVAIFENLSAFADYRAYRARPVMVFGGTDSYDLLSVGRFAIRESGDGVAQRPAPIFIAQSENLVRIEEIKGISTDLVLHNIDAEDLYLYMNRGELSIARPEPVDPEHWSLAIYSFGIQQPFPSQDHAIGNSLYGQLTFADYAITSSKAGSGARRVFPVPESGSYVVMMRSYGGERNSDLTASVDNGEPALIDQSAHDGYRWLRLWEGELSAGEHSVDVTLAEDKPVYIDSVVAIRAESVAEGAATALDDFVDAEATYIVNHRNFTLDAASNKARTEVAVGRTGIYTPTFRLAAHSEVPANKTATLLIDGRSVGGVRLASLTGDPREFTLPRVMLEAGRHEITVAGLVEGVYFDLVSLSEGTSMDGAAEGTAAPIAFERTGPSEYTIDAAAHNDDEKLFVVFNETNHPGWAMRQNGETIKPMVVNMFMNGFIVDAGPDAEKAVIRYADGVQRAGVAVSGLTLFGIAIVAVAGLRRSGR